MTLKLLVVANFLGAVASSALLTKGMFAFGPNGDSILAFLVGSTLSLLLILKFRHNVARVGGWLALASAALTLSLMGVLPHRTELAFGLLCLQFSCSFVSRAFRSDRAAGNGGRLPWVELAHSLGYTIGLLGAQRLSLELTSILPACAAAYGAAGALDLVVTRFAEDTGPSPASSPAAASRGTGATAAIAILVALTVAVQIATQMLSKHLGTTDPLAAFDMGTTLAPIAYGTLLFGLVAVGRALFWTELRSRKGPSLPFGVGVVLCLAAMASANFFLPEPGRLIGLVLVGLAAFLYEFLALALLDWLGETYRGTGAVSLAYGLMALVGTAAYGAFLRWEWRLPQIALVTLACTLAAGFALFGRTTARLADSC